MEHDGHYHVLAIHSCNIVSETLFAMYADTDASWHVVDTWYFFLFGFSINCIKKGSETFFPQCLNDCC
jgi:hypothetical protein